MSCYILLGSSRTLSEDNSAHQFYAGADILKERLLRYHSIPHGTVFGWHCLAD